MSTPSSNLGAEAWCPTPHIDASPDVATIFLKNPNRIEALVTLYVLALPVQALVERELRLAMKRERLKESPLYPEQRYCKRPTAEQILRRFSLAECHADARAAETVAMKALRKTSLRSA